ncbi:MAG TPA: NAD(P)H-binding protein [Microbacteriaceae bacterium]|nr:NAD(P)H-binding protein [Microbacteriaceae bacterium]
MARLVIFGGTGYSGGNIARDALRRGHTVVSYARHAPREPIDGVEYRIGSVTDRDIVARAAADADELVVALRAASVEGGLAAHVPALVAAAVASGARLSFVGGAGSSLVAAGGPRLVDTAGFREEWKPEALAHAAVLAALQAAPEGLDWFYVSPAGLYGAQVPGETTGAYRDGGDVLVVKDDGGSEISGTDFALAYVDEIERHAHPRRRFTVGH